MRKCSTFFLSWVLSCLFSRQLLGAYQTGAFSPLIFIGLCCLTRIQLDTLLTICYIPIPVTGLNHTTRPWSIISIDITGPIKPWKSACGRRSISPYLNCRKWLAMICILVPLTQSTFNCNSLFFFSSKKWNWMLLDKYFVGWICIEKNSGRCYGTQLSIHKEEEEEEEPQKCCFNITRALLLWLYA